MDQFELEQVLSQARELLPDAQAAYGRLRGLLDYPGQLDSAAAFRAAFDAFALICDARPTPDLAQLARAADPQDPNSLFAFAHRAYEYGLHAFAATCLARAHQLDPGGDFLAELVANLEELRLNREAVRLLQQSPVDQDPWLAYLLGFHALMSGDTELPHRLLPRLLAQNDDNLALAVVQLQAMVERARRLACSELRGWHLALNASLLLFVSPDGFDRGMNGRYAFVQDYYAQCRQGLVLLGEALDALGLSVPRVFALQDRSSQILAEAAAAFFSAPLAAWPSELPGLAVAYDLDRVDNRDLEPLAHHRPGQLLFAHASCWTSPFPMAPDFTTFLYQYNSAPWDERMRFSPDGESEMQPADPSPAEELGRRILDSQDEWPSHGGVEPLLELCAAARRLPQECTIGCYRQDGLRTRQRAGSPISSNSF
ncbi:MAG: hypothetical protein AB7S38_34080 [Vulcanimicrobiota bacterium]